MVTTLSFPEDFYKEELLCDYYVTSKQKKIWACEIDLAYKLLEVCKKYNVRIIAFAGTLLGAIRHKGFIPWDDDMDFCMLRGDYEKLVSIAEQEFTFPYFFQTALSDRNQFIGYARLRNSSTTGVISGHSSDYNCGIYIDIFVMDGYIENIKLYKNQMLKIDLLTRIFILSRSLKCNQSLIKKIIRSGIRFCVQKEKIYLFLFKLYNKIISRYTSKTDRLTFLTHNKYLREKYWIKKEAFNRISFVPFSIIEIPIPDNYDTILKNIYGEYMSFPPISERGKWHEGIIYFDPDMPYSEYFRTTKNDKKD